jgi:excisionase family DNA binding protein
MKSQEWLSIQDVAKHLGVSKETIYRLVARNKIPKHRLGKLWRFNKEEVNKWLIKR